ncbi:cell wall-active antibiotics response protein LiaF [Alkalihalobacillus sp. LMS39]|uniref:cell wall-active antibiotics response protein LiaF n=1 Tax=Alkalihalobacillus sp. LMS39 TaxID=2924032 RepID=UPI001FB32599|nr:cell wall-active antibiotics response protein LiaF [Alkalihalobacillus sp. LMS39]UOE95509.1 cell wall-active antibiotics response protein LiaF [Alkalihalobacillus sp. LMS39]
MQLSRKGFLGILIIGIGVIALLNTLNVNIHIGSFIGPLIFLFLGLYFHSKGHKVLSVIFVVIGIIALFENVFRINIAGIMIASVFIYFGYRLLVGPQKEQQSPYHSEETDFERDLEIEIDEQIETIKEKTRVQTEESNHDREESDKKKTFTSPTFRSTLIGDLHLLSRFELQDMTIRNGIGDIKVDLSKAIIPEGETVVVVQGWIGDIDIYIPDDLDVTVQAMVSIGELDVFENNQSGFNRNLSVTTKGYKQAQRRVKIILSLFIGDIDVRYV